MKDKIAAKSVIDQYEWPIFVGLLLLAFSIHYYSTYGGLIWTSDSFHYWAASRSFIEDGTLKAVDGGSLTFWPPLFPVILSLFSESTFHLFHSLCFISTLFFVYLYIKKAINKNIGLVTLSITILSVYPFLMSSFLWTETIFSLLLFSGLFYYLTWLKDKTKNNNLFLSVALFCLMCLQRNAGVFIIIGLSIYWLSHFIQKRNWSILLKMASLHLLIVMPNIVWNLNQKIFNTTDYNFSSRPFVIDFFNNLETLSIELIRFFIPYKVDSNFALTILLGIIILWIASTHNRKALHYYVMTFYILLFLLLPKFEFSEVGRFLAPIFPIIILQLVLLSKHVLSKFYSRKMKVGILTIITLILLYNIARTTKNVGQWHYRSIHHPKSAKIFF
jgi:hypothetical protein